MTDSNIAIYFVDVETKWLIYIILFLLPFFFLLLILYSFCSFIYEAFLRKAFTTSTTLSFSLFFLSLFRQERNSGANSFTDTIFSFLKSSWLSRSYLLQSLSRLRNFYTYGQDNFEHAYLISRWRRSRIKCPVRNFT